MAFKELKEKELLAMNKEEQEKVLSRDTYLKNVIHIYEKYKDVIDDMEIIPEPILQPLIFAIHYAAEIERDNLKSRFTLL